MCSSDLEAQDEIAPPVERVVLQDVHENRLRADRNHGFRDRVVDAANSGAFSSAQDYDVHQIARILEIDPQANDFHEAP